MTGVNHKCRSKLIAPALIIVLLCLGVGIILYQSNMKEQGRDIFIEVIATNDKNEQANSSEIWISSIYINDELYDIASIALPEGWEIKDGGIFCANQGVDSKLDIQISNVHNAKINFQKHAWSGIVEIKCEKYTKIVDLYSDNVDFEEITVYTNENNNKNIYGILIIVIGYVTYLIIISQFFNRKLYSKKIIWCMYCTLYVANLYFLFCTSPRINSSVLTRSVLVVLSILSIVMNYLGVKDECMRKYFSKYKVFALSVISLYSGLVSFAGRFFLTGDTRPTITVEGSIYCLSGMIWFTTIIFAILFLMENLSSKGKKIETNKSNRKKAFFTLFAVLTVCQTIIWIAFWPGGYPYDAMVQMGQATYKELLNDWHPVLHTLFLRLIYTIVPDLGIITLVQMIIFALLCTMILMIGYDYGINIKVLCFLGSIFILLPNQAFSSIGVVKDYPYMLSLLWGTYLLIKLGIDINECKKLSYLLALMSDMFLIYGLRHNGVVPFLFMISLCVVLTIKYFMIIKFRLLFISLGVIISVIFYKGYIFDILNVQPNSVSSYTTMLTAVGSCINKGLPLSEDATEIMESIMPLEDWAEYYSRYQGHDRYAWGRDEDKEMKTAHITAKNAFCVYLEALFKYPDVVIKDRLDGTNIMWDVTQPYESFNARSHDYVHCVDETKNYIDLKKLGENFGEGYYNNSVIAEVYRNFLNVKHNNIADMLLWRTGAYIIMLFILVLFCWTNKLRCLWIGAMPLLGQILSLMLVLYHQSFRYVHNIQILVVALFFMVMCCKNEMLLKQKS